MKFTNFKIIIILIISFVAGVWAADIFFNGLRNPFAESGDRGIEYQDRSLESENRVISSSTPFPSASPVISHPPQKSPPEILTEQNVLLTVPFISQAPFGNWKDPKQQDGCEEASAIMAMAWVKGDALTKEGALEEITAIADYEQKNYGNYHDTDAEDTAKRIFEGYFGYDNIEVRHGIDTDDIKQELFKGNLVIVPVNGRKLGNPYYTPPGPLEHNLVIRGWDMAKKEFITNDSGMVTRGENYRYKEDVLQGALFDYPTGYHEPLGETKTAMTVVKK